LLASTLKKANEYIHGTISGDGVLKRVVAECNGAGDCRGYTAPFTLVSVLGQREGSQDSKVPESVGEAIGQGRLTVTKGSYGEGTPYAAIVDLATGEIAADFARFLTESEQIPSAVAAGVKLNHKGQVISAGGILVQRLGGAVVSDDELKGLGDKISKINLSDRIALGESAEDLIKYMQDTQEAWGLLAQRELRFKCTCTREKMALTAMGLGPAELENLISEVGKIEVNCAYCSSSQQFNLSELAKH
jgi:molecular chaperone Hsp33